MFQRRQYTRKIVCIGYTQQQQLPTLKILLFSKINSFPSPSQCIIGKYPYPVVIKKDFSLTLLLRKGVHFFIFVLQNERFINFQHVVYLLSFYDEIILRWYRYEYHFRRRENSEQVYKYMTILKRRQLQKIQDFRRDSVGLPQSIALTANKKTLSLFEVLSN